MEGKQAMADFVFASTYARFRDDLGRRETFDEAVERMETMHSTFYADQVRAYPLLGDTISEAFAAVKQKKVLASQRALQFGGDPVLKKHMRIYNCATSYCDRSRFFAEALYMGLCGVGVGFSVQRVHTRCLPSLISRDEWASRVSFEHVVEDSIEGWANAVNELIAFYLEGGLCPDFDYTQIREKGARISAGGTAPGSEPLEIAIEKMDELLSTLVLEGVTQLEPIHCFDLAMFASEAVISGGRRRAATIALFDKDDEAMLNAKTGDWFHKNKQRGLANISAVQVIGEESRKDFARVVQSAKECGEPGVIFTHSRAYVYNPCVEIGMCPVLIRDAVGKVVEEYTLDMLNNRQVYMNKGYTYESGWQTCNLTEINGGMIETEEDLVYAAKQAAVIGTLQAGFTQHGYLSPVTQGILEREALIGVSITGIMDSPHILLNEGMLSRAAQIVKETNTHLASILGIRPAARTTCVKPAGTTSILLGTSSGIHPHFGRRVIRHIQMNVNNPVLRLFRDHNESLTEESAWSSNHTDRVVSFPIEVREDAILRDSLTAVEFLEHVRTVQRAWVTPGTARPESTEALKHNVSNTCPVKADEWGAVEEYLWEHRHDLTGVAMLGDMGELCYAQLPNQVVPTREEYRARFGDEAADILDQGEVPYDVEHEDQGALVYHARGILKFERIKAELSPVPYQGWLEASDTTNPTVDTACAGGSCEITYL